MDEVKGLFYSKTFYGVLVSLLGKLLSAVAGVEIDDEAQAQLVSVIMLFVSGAGDLLAIYGRIKATKKIG